MTKHKVFECGCVATHGADGTYLGGSFCAQLDRVFELVVGAKFSNRSWELMERGITKHLDSVRQLAEL